MVRCISPCRLVRGSFSRWIIATLVGTLSLIEPSGFAQDANTTTAPAAPAVASSAGPIAAKLQPFVESHLLAGAVTVVAKPDAVLDVETVGYSDIAAGKPITPDAVFWIASMSKPITATAVMMLVDEGKIKLDDPVENYLPEFKEQWVAVERDGEHMLLQRPTPKVTVRHVLSHTSGMPFKSAAETPTLDMLPLAVAVRSYAMTPLDHQPGTHYAYSNAGINTAARILEVVSGMPYEQFMQQRLFDPLGMRDTTFWPSGEQLQRLVKPYKPNKDKNALEETTISQLYYPLDDRRRQPMPAGGLFSTAADVTTFCRMILSGGEFQGRRYVSPEAIREMSTNQTGDLPQTYGLGWSTTRQAGGGFNHGGALSTFMSIDPDRKLALVYLVQHAGFPPEEKGKVLNTFKQTAIETFNK